MKFLTIVPNLGYRGTQRAGQNYSIAMADRGHRVAVLTLSEGGSREEELRKRGIDVWIGGDDHQQAIREAINLKADVIHIHRTGVHDSLWGDVLRQLKTSDVRVLETNVFGRVDYSSDASLIDVHLQISRWCLYRWRKWLGQRKQIGVYLPYVVDLEGFPVRKAFDRQESRQSFNLLSAGFVCGRIGKWRPHIFYAFAALVKRQPDALLLNVLDHAEAKTFADRMPVEIRSRIVTIPRLLNDKDLSRFYASLDCLLQVSPNGESFGMVLAEAMACGTPVVTASTPHKDNAQVEVVQHNQGGIVAGSSARLGDALIAFSENAQLQRECALQARRLIAERYDMKSIGEKLETIAMLALASKDKQDLSVRLHEDKSIETDIDQSEISKSITNTLGAPSKAELALMRLVHNPDVFRAYSRMTKGC